MKCENCNAELKQESTTNLTRDEEALKRFLNLKWLRPEAALTNVFKEKAYFDIKFESPSLDISCGDGIMMFLRLGGKFSEGFDYYKKTKAKEFKHDAFVDIYDDYDENYSVDVVKEADFKVDVGTDWKQALLDKAKKVGIYKQLLLHDNNKIPMPLPDNHFKTIYSNSVYWVQDPGSLLKDIYRILQPGGTAIIQLITPYHTKTLDEIEPFLNKEAIDILDRTRRSTFKGSRVYSEWKKLVDEAGFVIKDTRSVYPSKLMIDIWNIGLRPISHLLIQMSETLPEEQRIKIKREWTDIFFKLLRPLLTYNDPYPLEQAPYVTFILTKE